MFEWLIPGVIVVGNYLIGTIFFKYIFTRWLAAGLAEFFKFIVVRTHRNAVYWVHYREKAWNHGHQYATPEVCEDGVCKSYRATLLK